MKKAINILNKRIVRLNTKLLRYRASDFKEGKERRRLFDKVQELKYFRTKLEKIDKGEDSEFSKEISFEISERLPKEFPNASKGFLIQKGIFEYYLGFVKDE